MTADNTVNHFLEGCTAATSYVWLAARFPSDLRLDFKPFPGLNSNNNGCISFLWPVHSFWVWFDIVLVIIHDILHACKVWCNLFSLWLLELKPQPNWSKTTMMIGVDHVYIIDIMFDFEFFKICIVAWLSGGGSQFNLQLVQGLRHTELYFT